MAKHKGFNPLDRGNLNQISLMRSSLRMERIILFQSPRSGKFESNLRKVATPRMTIKIGFNPLDRGNLNQIGSVTT